MNVPHVRALRKAIGPNPPVLWMLAAGLAVGGGGCATRRAPSPLEGQALFAALQQAVGAAGKKAEPSLALVKSEKSTPPTRRTVGGVTFVMRNPADISPSGGILLTPRGHVLVPGVIKPDQDDRLTVVVGETEHVARSIKVDDTLGMTILKVDSDEAFEALDLADGADLAVGEWAVVLKPTDEDSAFQKLSLLAVCQGEKAGRYRRFLLNQPLASSAGALVVNLSGQVVGVVDKTSGVLSINDVREDLQRFLADATGERLPDEELQKKGWLGAVFEPVNKEYARARNLPSSALLVLHAARNSPAAAAGMRAGDWVVGLNGKPLRLSGALALEYFSKSLRPRAGEPFGVTVLRHGKPVELKGTYTKAPQPKTLRAEDLGVTVTGITDSMLFSQNLGTEHGVLVTEVHRGSPAANSGSARQTLIVNKDIIVELAGQPTPTIAAFGKVLETIRRDRPPVVLVKYYRGWLTGYAGLNLTLGEQNPASQE
ncbi:MAG: hypothetical protein JXQ71_14655 [Verrucomicrobia bacterium]|nr:hypothetical protein [Verrucomicrobiota bacterium]